MLDVQDELHNIAAALACVPELRMFAVVMRDILHPPAAAELMASHDRIGCALRSLPKDRAAAAGALPKRSGAGAALPFSEAECMDMESAIDAIITVAQFRTKRLAALMAAM